MVWVLSNLKHVREMYDHPHPTPIVPAGSSCGNTLALPTGVPTPSNTIAPTALTANSKTATLPRKTETRGPQTPHVVHQPVILTMTGLSVLSTLARHASEVRPRPMCSKRRTDRFVGGEEKVGAPSKFQLAEIPDFRPELR